MNLRFIGSDGSMGLKYGKVYKVKFRPGSRIEITWFPFLKYCPYASLAAFCRNWEDAK